MIDLPQSRPAAALAGPAGRVGTRASELPVLRLGVKLLTPEAYAIQRSAVRRQREWERARAA